MAKKRSLAALAIAIASTPAVPIAAQGNIIVVVADDFGVDLVGAYGLATDPLPTPNLDSLAEGGVLFTQAWAHPLCTPSRVSLHTGLYPFRTGVGAHIQDGEHTLSLSHVTLPEGLDALDRGYDHALFGKWHLSNDLTGGALGANLAGYAHFAGVMANLGIQPEDYFEWEKVVDGTTFTQQGYITSDTVDDAVAWILEAEEPWFAFVSFNAPHAPLHAPPAHLHSVDLSGAGPPKQDPEPYFEAMVEALDTEIGRLLTSTEAAGERTVIFMGDNGTTGERSLAPFPTWQGKGTAYETGVRVPLIVSGAGIAQGRACDHLVSVADLFATVMEVADLGTAGRPPTTDEPLRGSEPGKSPRDDVGLEPPYAFPSASSGRPYARDSYSMVPHFGGGVHSATRPFVFTEMFLPNGPGPPQRYRRALRGTRYKLMINLSQLDPPLTEGTFLFDLEEDPYEGRNLLDQPSLTPKQAAAYTKLTQLMTQLLSNECPESGVLSGARVSPRAASPS